MKTLYLDCGMGAAGDMLAAALLELLPDPDKFVEKLNALAIPGVEIKKETAVKCGITGTHLSVTVNGEEEESHDHHHHEHEHEHEHEHHHEHHHHHHHSGMHEIEHIVWDLHLPLKVQEDVLAVYKRIAEAESHAHGCPVEEIHFHEVGTMDAVADITAVCLLMQELAPDEVVVSPVHVGSGQVHCAHGILPVPAPATAYLLKDVPIYGGAVRGELCTPTGAALLRHFASRFGEMPVMKLRAVGYGMGKKDFEAANCVRAMLGDSEIAEGEDTVLELCCNLDDMTAEAVGFAMDRLLEGGALDVYTTAIGMKKSRPGVLLHLLCQESDREKMISLLFRHTSTLGVRELPAKRHVLHREIEALQTPYGEIRRKHATGYGVDRRKYEYDDLAAAALREGVSLDEMKKRIDGAAETKEAHDCK